MPDDTAQRDPEWSDSGAVARARLRERLGGTAPDAASMQPLDRLAEVFEAAGPFAKAIREFDAAPTQGLRSSHWPDGYTGWQPGDDLTLGDWRRLARAVGDPPPKVERGRWYPEMPPMLPDETPEQYTDRLTGADGTGRRPYDHHRNRQCSIGRHDQCSDPEGKRCKCPCHESAEKAPEGYVVRRAADSDFERLQVARRDGYGRAVSLPGHAPAALALTEGIGTLIAGALNATLDNLPATDEGAPPCESCAKPSTCEDLSGTRLCDDCAEPLLVGQHEGSMDAEGELHTTPECGARPAGEPLAACSYPRGHEGNHYDRSTGIEWVAVPTRAAGEMRIGAEPSAAAIDEYEAVPKWAATATPETSDEAIQSVTGRVRLRAIEEFSLRTSPPFRSGEYEGAVTGLVFSYHGHQVSLKRDAAGWWYAVGPTAKGAPADCPPRPDCRGGPYPFDDALDLATDAVRRYKLRWSAR